MAVTGLVEQKSPIGNGMPGVHFFPYSYCARCPLGLRPDSCHTNCVEYLEASLRDSNGGVPAPAAVILELVQGEGGVVVPRRDFVRRIRQLTAELDVPLVVDEVQTGCGRTGTWFAFEQYGIEPDVIVASKALSGIGIPAAIILYNERLDVWAPGAHTGTFRGNQLAFAAGVKTIQILRRDDILGNVRRRGEQIAGRLSGLRESQWVGEIRGLGLMWGVELVDPITRRPAGRLARAVQARALRLGLIVEVGGRDDCVVRFLPPLNVSADVVDTACEILSTALSDCTDGIPSSVGLMPPLGSARPPRTTAINAASGAPASVGAQEG